MIRDHVVPILMYHKVGSPVRERADRFLNVSLASFRRQMDILRRLGYTGITVTEAVEGLFGHRELPRRPVCITFDDGYASVIEYAAPVLSNFGWPGVVFVATHHVGSVNGWDRGSKHPLNAIMDWDDIERLRCRGWEIAGHTMLHPHLADLEDSQAFAEINGGREMIRKRLAVDPRTFCYPFGSFNERTIEMVRRAGFVGACTTKSGLASALDDPLLLPRVKVSYSDRVSGFVYRLFVRPAGRSLASTALGERRARRDTPIKKSESASLR